MILYGLSGIGKTSFAANFPKVGFIVDPHEKGINDLVRFKQCPKPVHVYEAESWSNLLASCDLAAKRKDISTLVFDSATGMEQLCFMHHCEKAFDNDWTSKGFFSFQQGPKGAAKRDWPDLITKFEMLRDMGKNVILLAHSQVKPFPNPSGPDFNRYCACLDKETWAITARWATCILFYKMEIDVKKEGPRMKAEAGTDRRLICTVHSAAEYDAKNRYGLEPIISAGSSGKEAYDAFMKNYRKCAG